MIARMVTGTMFVIVGGFVTGVATSSYRHYYRRYAEDEDLRQKGEVQEVVIVADETKKSRRSKK